MRERKDDQQLPRVPFAIVELAAIGEVIGGYLNYTERLPPSPEGEQRIAILKNVQERLQAQLRTFQPGTLIQLALSAQEVAELLTAMMGFVEQIQRFFPQKDERDKAIRTVNAWKLRLIAITSEHVID